MTPRLTQEREQEIRDFLSGPYRVAASMDTIELLAEVDALREELERLRAERSDLKKRHEDNLSRWEVREGRFVTTREAIAQDLAEARALAKRLVEAVEDAGKAIHSEYCFGNRHHRECIGVTKALRNLPAWAKERGDLQDLIDSAINPCPSQRGER